MEVGVRAGITTPPHIHHLPTELLSHIFEFVCSENFLQEYPWESPFDPITTLSAPVICYLPALALCAVCMRWRSLALELPILWSHLKLEITEPKISTSNEGFMSTLQLYLHRSADAPLFLVIDVDEGEAYDGRNPAALNLLLKQAARWKTISYSTADVAHLEVSSLPMLEELTLPNGWNDLIFQDAPKLRVVTVSNHRGRVCKLPRSVSQLTVSSVFMEHSIIDDLRLQDFPNLTSLRLHGFPAAPSVRVATTTLDRLESFTVMSDLEDSTMLETLLSAFTLPSLTELIIQPPSQFTSTLEWSMKAFDSFVSRSSCTLTSLSISRVPISDFEFIAALRLLPSLITLRIFQVAKTKNVKSMITTHFLTSLILHDPRHGTSLIPKLRCLSVKVNDTSFDDAAFVRMVASRWLPDADMISIGCLRSVVLHFTEREVVEQAYELLYSLDRKGMRVVITGKVVRPNKLKSYRAKFRSIFT